MPSNATPDTPPGTLGPDEFLDRYWQKAPALIRASPDSPRPETMAALVPRPLPRIDRGELIRLATVPGIPSRLIRNAGPPRGWSTRRGPFVEGEFAGLAPADWTLLVQEVDRRLPAFASLLERFRFVPNWRIDDVMLSYATDGGGVGPHIDRYDVFLLQLKGRRRWRIASTPIERERLVQGLELPVLARFEHDREWVLEPGDMLYLPPRIAHEGVALGECITCSIGFRVPDPRELCAGFVRQSSPELFERIRYTDPGLRRPARLGEISAAARRRLRDSALRLFDDAERFDHWVGCFVTRPLREPPATTAIGSVDELRDRLDAGARLMRSAPAHFAWFRDDAGAVQLFVGGERYPLDGGFEADAELLCGTAPLDRAAVLGWLADERFAGIVIDLVLRGHLVVPA